MGKSEARRELISVLNLALLKFLFGGFSVLNLLLLNFLEILFVCYSKAGGVLFTSEGYVVEPQHFL